jgi:hypothetical protein
LSPCYCYYFGPSWALVTVITFAILDLLLLLLLWPFWSSCYCYYFGLPWVLVTVITLALLEPLLLLLLWPFLSSCYCYYFGHSLALVTLITLALLGLLLLLLIWPFLSSCYCYYFGPSWATVTVITLTLLIFGSFPKLRKKLSASSCLSALLPAFRTKQLSSHWTNFYEIWYCIFSKTCREDSNFIKIWQESRVLYMKTNIHCWSYLDQVFLE